MSTTISDTALISRMNRGPVSDIPASCVETLTSKDDNVYFGHSNDAFFDEACLPTGTQQPVDWNSYYYSPATICPSNYGAATTFPQSFMGGWYYFVSLSPETSAVLCCPSGFSYYTYGHFCSSTIESGQVFTYVSPYLDAGKWSRGNVYTTSALKEYRAVGDGMIILWQDSDVTARTPSSTSSVSTTETLVGSSASPRTTFSSFPQSTTTSSGLLQSTTSGSTATSNVTYISSPSGGLSTGAKVGLGVGIPVAVLAGLALGYLFFRQRNRKQAFSDRGPVTGLEVAEPGTVQKSTSHGHPLSGLEVVSPASVSPVKTMQPTLVPSHEVQGTPRYEMHEAYTARHELH